MHRHRRCYCSFQRIASHKSTTGKHNIGDEVDRRHCKKGCEIQLQWYGGSKDILVDFNMATSTMRRKCVCFPENPVHSVIVFDDSVARNYPNVIWYSLMEMQYIKERNLESIRRCRLYGPLEETERETFLGLDVLVERKKARWKRNQICQAVFFEQSRQEIMHHQKSPELLAEAYRQKMEQVNMLVPSKQMCVRTYYSKLT